MVADSGYTTRENIEKMAGREIDFLGTMRHEDVPRGANLANRFPPSAFLYQPERNRCVCPEGKVLLPQARRKVGAGMTYHLYEARLEDCRSCRSQTGVLSGQPEARPLRSATGRKPGGGGVSQEDGQRGSPGSNIVVVDESWSFVTPGSRASWGCGSSMCGAWRKCRWKCCGLASPTTCSTGSACKSSTPHQPSPDREREQREEPRPSLKIASQHFRKLRPNPQSLSTSRFLHTFPGTCPVTRVISMGRCNTKLQPTWH